MKFLLSETPDYFGSEKGKHDDNGAVGRGFPAYEAISLSHQNNLDNIYVILLAYKPKTGRRENWDKYLQFRCAVDQMTRLATVSGNVNL